jgi:hypothetical protein
MTKCKKQPDTIAISWHIEDVREVRAGLTDEQARKVSQALKRNHDATIGINWEVLETTADFLFPTNE